MDKVIISDASCLIALFEIGKIHILKEVFTQIVTTQEVALEFGHDIPSWISIKKPANDITKNELERVLDSGEASAIALALENPSQSILIIDEKKGRKVAIENNCRSDRHIEGFVAGKREACDTFSKRNNYRTCQKEFSI